MKKSRCFAGLLACMVTLVMTATLLPVQPPQAQAQAQAQAVAIERNHIKQVIYPTFGYPQISRCRDQFTVEFDPRDQNWAAPLPALKAFTVYANTSSSDYPLNLQLRVDSFTVGYSQRWPEYSRAAQPAALIYLVNVTIPDTIPFDLYDLTVNGQTIYGGWISDAQPHSLSVVEEFKDDYDICQLTDIHVWGPEAAYPGSNSTHQRNYRHADYREEDGYGAEYFHKTIQQVNLENPDICVFTGDFDFSQKWVYQEDYSSFSAYQGTPWSGYYYEPWFEMDWFYQEAMTMDVPVFMVPGNHDGYARYNLNNTQLEEDYKASWRDLFGPEYFSFDYGSDYHFTALNTNDWTSLQRNLHWLIPDVILTPGKWQGQLQGSGDAFKAGWSQARENAIDLAALTGQLAWARDDLAAHAGAKMRVMLMHCCPWRQDGSGLLFDNAGMFGITFGGEGAGRLASIKLARENDVALVLSGHEHSDAYGSISWTGGGGEVKFVNTTSTMFQDAPSVLNPKWDAMWVYPGYRTVHVDNADVVNFYYQLANDQNGHPLQYSWPIYQGTNIGSTTNFANLTQAAVLSAWAPEPGTAQDVTCTITNTLTGREVVSGGEWSGDLRAAGLDFPMPYLNGGYYYTATGGSFKEAYDFGAGPSERVFKVETDVGHAVGAGTPTVKAISVNKSATPDLSPPTCSMFQIDGGAFSTGDADVVLTNNAVDPGGAGLYDMMISNDDPTFAGCEWQSYEASIDWTLKKQGGLRTVYVKFRDAAMPGNVSAVYPATIILVGLPPSIGSVVPPSAHTGETVVVNGSDFGAPRTFHDYVTLGGTSMEVTLWTDTAITCVVPPNGVSGTLAVANDAGSASTSFQVLPVISSITPDYGYNDRTVEITDLAGSGFYASTGYPVVKLVSGAVEIPGTNVEVPSPQSITCGFDLTGAATGYYDVVMENADGGTDTLNGGFSVDYPPPEVTGITPAAGVVGSTVDASITGACFRDGAVVELRLEGVVIDGSGVTVVSAESVTCSFDLTGAALGAWDVVVINPDAESGSLTGGFTVGSQPPEVTGITPATGMVGGTVDTSITGACFHDGAVVELRREGVVIDGSGVTVVSPESITCSFDLTGAAPGAWDVVVTNPDAESGSLTGGFTVSNSIFYFAEGTCRPNFVPYICIQNPGENPAEVSITYMKGNGTTVNREVTVDPATRLTVLPADDLGTGDDAAHDFSSVVECTNGQRIVAERPMYFNYAGEWTGGSTVVGATSPRTRWLFAEGTCRPDFDTWLCIQNPGDTGAKVRITYLKGDATQVEEEVDVAEHSRLTVFPRDKLGTADDAAHDFSSVVECTNGQPIVAERPMYFNYTGSGSGEGWNGGHDVVGAFEPGTSFYFAEGYTGQNSFDEWLCLANPGEQTAMVDITYMFPDGTSKAQQVSVAGASRQTVSVNDAAGPDREVSVKMVSDQPIVAERPMYFDYVGSGSGEWTGGSCVIGAAAAGMDWMFAEGYTGSDFVEWLTLFNPGDSECGVTVTYMPQGGTAFTRSHVVPAHSRYTINVNADAGADLQLSCRVVVTSGPGVVAERPMYFNYTGSGSGEGWNGGHDVVGYTP